MEAEGRANMIDQVIPRKGEADSKSSGWDKRHFLEWKGLVGATALEILCVPVDEKMSQRWRESQ